MLRLPPIVAILVLLAPCIALAAETDMPLVHEDDFEKGADAWTPTDADAWRILQTDDTAVYNQFQNSDYKPPHRSPLNISLLNDVSVGDFVLTVKVKSTNGTAGAHQDMCLFFNYQDSAHFYYVHLGKRPDPHSCQIMIVNDAPRVMITQNESPGIPWDDAWHTVRIARRVSTGTIQIYFDDMKKPVLTAVDKTFTSGQVGLGSFDDNGCWDDFRLHGLKTVK